MKFNSIPRITEEQQKILPENLLSTDICPVLLANAHSQVSLNIKILPDLAYFFSLLLLIGPTEIQQKLFTSGTSEIIALVRKCEVLHLHTSFT